VRRESDIRARLGSAIGGAAVAALAVATLAGCSSTAIARRSGPSTTTTGGTATTGVPGATSGSFSWSLDADPHLALGGGPGTTLSAVLSPSAGGAGWVIAGTRDNGSGATTATVWTSPDAVTWNATALTGGGVSSAASAAATWKTSTVVVGSVGTGTERRAQVWVSQGPGSSFVEVPVTSTNDSPSTMDHVTVGNLGYFATGTIAGQPAVWYSTNGLQWSVSSGATRFLDGFPGAQVNALLATSNFVYAAGSVRDGTATDAALWSTQDGIDWKPIISSQGAFSGGGDHVITGLAPLGTLPSGGGLLAVGGVEAAGAWTPASWISPDGVSWSQPAGDFPRSAGSEEVRSVAPVATLVGPSEFFATGGGPSDQHLWQSSDGVRWNQIPFPPAAASADGWRATLVASDGNTTVVADGDQGQAHVLTGSSKGWSEPSANAPVFGPVAASADVVSLSQGKTGLELTVKLTQAPQAIGSASVSTVTFSSANGVNWSPLPAGQASTWPPAPLPAGASAIDRAGTGWIAVGSGPPGSPPPASGPETSGVGLTWTSADGSHWNPPTTLDPKPGIGPEHPRGICSSTGEAVAVGEADHQGSGATAAAAWYTNNGSQWKPAGIVPAAAPGSGTEMLGCVQTQSGFAAFGAASGPGGDSPALWSSPDGAHWTRGNSDFFGSGAPGPIVSLAVSGPNWLAVASGAADSEPDDFPGPSPSASTASEANQLGVWVSTDSGSTWQRLDGNGGVWQDAQGAVLEEAGFAGSRAVVAGEVGGRLVVWTGGRS